MQETAGSLQKAASSRQPIGWRTATLEVGGKGRSRISDFELRITKLEMTALRLERF
jgi:hypothetical protein